MNKFDVWYSGLPKARPKLNMPMPLLGKLKFVLVLGKGCENETVSQRSNHA